EAAASFCNIVITDKGYTRDYFGEDAFYCDPGDPGSIYKAVENAAQSPLPEKLSEKIITRYTWEEAASVTLHAYKKVLNQ
ncbi:MAG TPA: hypothetical protein VLJ68_05240, partial [Chitinophagaceae bacterium]|nr:hypothetical protein [Chitinophagaceae bacterium]